MSLAAIFGGTEKIDKFDPEQKEMITASAREGQRSITGAGSLIGNLAQNRESSFDLASNPANNLNALFSDIDARTMQDVGNVLHSGEAFSSGNRAMRLATSMGASAQKNTLQHQFNEARRSEELLGLESALSRQASLAQGWGQFGLGAGRLGSTEMYNIVQHKGLLPSLGEAALGGLAGSLTGGLGAGLSKGIMAGITKGFGTKNSAGGGSSWF